MKILVFTSTFYEETPFDQWLEELGAEFFILAPNRTRKSYAKFSNYFPFLRYWSNQNIELKALELTREHRFDAILAKDEWDQLRAARVRDSAAIPGPSFAAANFFRDKLSMKSNLRNAGVPVAPFAKCDHVFNAKAFIDLHGYPVVFKPIDGVAGAFTRIIKNSDEFSDYLTTGIPSNMMIETFVPGQLYHIDGLWSDNHVQFSTSSRYVNSCLSFQWGEYSGSVLLSETDSLHTELSAFTQRMLLALPTPPVTAFHSEIFVTPEGKLICCEIAARTGGARIVEQTNLKYGIHLDREWVRAQLGLPMNLNVQVRDTWLGHMFVPAKNGKILKLPELGKFDWALSEKIYPKQFEVLEEDPERRQNLASCIIEGEADADIAKHMSEWNQWVTEQTVWELP